MGCVVVGICMIVCRTSGCFLFFSYNFFCSYEFSFFFLLKFLDGGISVSFLFSIKYLIFE